MNRWYWTESSMKAGEVLSTTVSGVRLYDGNKRTDYENGYLTLTNLRILWKNSSNKMSLALDLYHVVYTDVETGGFLSTPKVILHINSGSDQTFHMKLGFKEGKMSLYNELLQEALKQKSWVASSIPVAIANKSSQSKVGILGIERAIANKHKEQDKNISLAFEDLKNLMSLAKNMVVLSKNISEKIRDKTGELSSDETVQLRSYLLGLGIEDPVTKNAIDSTTEYHKQLAHEISKTLLQSIKDAGGVMLLTEVFCRINRARGLHLLSPDDMLNACNAMKRLQLPLVLHQYKSGVQVLQLSSLNEENINKSVESVLQKHSATGLSFSEYAEVAGISLILAQERLHAAELKGVVLLDESSEGFRFYPNLFCD